MSLSSMLIHTAEIYDLVAWRNAAADADYSTFLVETIACRVQPLSEQEMTETGIWDVRPTHKMFYARGTIVESKTRIKYAGEWYDIVNVKYAQENNWPSKAMIRRVVVP